MQIVEKALESMEASDNDDKDLERLIGLIKHYANKENVDLRAYPKGTVSAFLNAAEVLLGKPFADIHPVEPEQRESIVQLDM